MIRCFGKCWKMLGSITSHAEGQEDDGWLCQAARFGVQRSVTHSPCKTWEAASNVKAGFTALQIFSLQAALLKQSDRKRHLQICMSLQDPDSRIYSAHSGFSPVAVNTDGCVTMNQDFSPCVDSIPSPVCLFTLSSRILYEND